MKSSTIVIFKNEYIIEDNVQFLNTLIKIFARKYKLITVLPSFLKVCQINYLTDIYKKNIKKI